MPKELPGFYFDAEKNRYFPYKGPIPGSTRPPLTKPPPPPPLPQTGSLCKIIKLRQELLMARELCGNVIFSSKEKFNFQSVYQKCHTSQPMVWKYKETKKIANIALGHVVANVSSPHGLTEKDILVSSGSNGLLSILIVEKADQEMHPMQSHKVDLVWPLNSDELPRSEELIKQLRSPPGCHKYLTSDVSCIKLLGKSCLPTDAMSKRFLITTLGSEHVSGSVYLLDLSEPLHLGAAFPVQGVNELASFKLTLWAADCDPEGRCAAIGTDRGVMLLNMETGRSSRVLRCKSDVLSLQFEHSGKVILCGLRNGGIMTVDTRQKPRRADRSSTTSMPSSDRSSTTSMPSSICCLTSLYHWDQYFLASSMDGSIMLFDQRLLQKGAIQSYAGNVNSYTRIELGVDPSEKFVMSGGQDCYIRIWDIKSSQMLFSKKFMKTIPAAVCWPRSSAFTTNSQDHSFGAWVGSYEGIFYMNWL